MSIPNIIIGLFVIIEFLLIMYASNQPKKNAKKSNFLGMRKGQGSSIREHALKKKFEKMAESRTKFDKKYKIETTCLQAGLKISYGEFIILSLVCAIILPIIIMVGLNNGVMALVGAFIGYVIPGQVISFIKNRRRKYLDAQVGTFIKLTSERYNMGGSFSDAIKACVSDFRGQEPMYTEIKIAAAELNIGNSVDDVMDGMSRRTGNRFLKRYADFYKITAKLGTTEARENILGEAYKQYDEYRKMSSKLKRDIAGPVNEAYILVSAIPLLVLYNCMATEGYLQFMTHTPFGKVGSAVISLIFIGCIWFINAKIAAPLE